MPLFLTGKKLGENSLPNRCRVSAKGETVPPSNADLKRVCICVQHGGGVGYDNYCSIGEDDVLLVVGWAAVETITRNK